MKKVSLLLLLCISICSFRTFGANTSSTSPYAFPNPFLANGKTCVEFFIPSAYGNVFRLEIYGVSGKLYRIIDSKCEQTGKKGLFWNGRDDEGRLVKSGIYFVYIKLKNTDNIPVRVFPLALYH